MLRPSAVLFDLDGTLVDTAPDLVAALNHVLVCEGRRPLAVKDAACMVGAGAETLVRRGFAVAGGLEESRLPALVESFLAYYSVHLTRRSRPFPQAREALHNLRRLGVRLGLCTNKRQGLSERILRNLGLARYFHGVTGTQEGGPLKPDPEHIFKALQDAGAGADAGGAVMVGDSVNDVRAARAAGLKVVVVSFGYGGATFEGDRGDAEIAAFSELLPLLCGGGVAKA